ncbi:hypothetical protein LSAT2_025770, partial [Lamellibrachia satsuma]
HFVDLQATRDHVEAVEAQTQENTVQLRQEATVLRAHEQQLQEARTAQENMTGSKCRLWTCCVGLLSVVVLLIAIFLQWNGQLVEHDGRLQDQSRHLGEVQRGVLDNTGHFEGLDHRVNGVEEGLDHKVQGVEMTTKVLLGFGAIFVVLVIVTMVWWMCYQRKDEPSPPCNLQVVEVCTDYVCVTWQAPVSDGNSPITRYVVEKADPNTHTFTIAGHTESDTLE